jgi:hypothetical protein
LSVWPPYTPYMDATPLELLHFPVPSIKGLEKKKMVEVMDEFRTVRPTGPPKKSAFHKTP